MEGPLTIFPTEVCYSCFVCPHMTCRYVTRTMEKHTSFSPVSHRCLLMEWTDPCLSLFLRVYSLLPGIATRLISDHFHSLKYSCLWHGPGSFQFPTQTLFINLINGPFPNLAQYPCTCVPDPRCVQAPSVSQAPAQLG